MIDTRLIKIRDRLLLGYSIPILLSIAAASFVFLEAGEVNHTAKALQNANHAALNLKNLEVKFFQIQKAARGYFLTKNTDFFDEYKLAIQEFDAIMGTLRQEVKDPQQQELLKRISELKPQIDQGYRAAFVMFDQRKREQGLVAWRSNVVPKLEEVERLSQEFQVRQAEILLPSQRKIEERVGSPMNRTQALRAQPFDADEWQKLYYRNQQQYMRQRLTAVKLLHEGHSRTQVSEQVGCRYDTLTSWIDTYSGFQMNKPQ